MATISEGWISRLMFSLIGTAWTLATIFVVPVMILENKGVIESIKQSASTFKKTWGESVIGQFGIGLFFLAVIIGSLFLSFVISFLLQPLLGISLFILLFMIAIPFVILIILLSSVLNEIYMTSLYIYATTKKIPQGFSPDFIKNAYARKS